MNEQLQEKLRAANVVLNSFAEGARISREPGGYPRIVDCVVCKKPILVKQFDWWPQPGLSGPCHLGPCEGKES